jgi:hypothetical protein
MKRSMVRLLITTLLLSFVLTGATEGIALEPGATPVAAQADDKALWDTGTLNLGVNQVLRITVNGLLGDDTIAVRFRRIAYTAGVCNDGICRLGIASQFTSAPMALAPGEGLSIDIQGTSSGIRGMVLSNNPNARVTAQIINTTTGEVDAVTIPKLDGQSKEAA